MNEHREQSFPPEKGAMLPMSPFEGERYSPHDLYMVVWSGIPDLNNAEISKLAEILLEPNNKEVRNQIAKILEIKRKTKGNEFGVMLEHFRAGNLDAALEIDNV